MYVRWKERRYYARRHEFMSLGARRHVMMLSAYLVHSERRDGKPRQRIVAYLGSLIKEGTRWEPTTTDALRDKLYTRSRLWFWQGVNHRLDALAKQDTISPQQRTAIEAQIERRVARLPADESEKMLEDERARSEGVQKMMEDYARSIGRS